MKYEEVEQDIREAIDNISFGEVIIQIQNNEIVRIEERKSKKL